MTPYRTPRLVVACIALALAGGACRTAAPPPQPTITIARKATRTDEITMAQADSEVFEAVLRTQLAGGTRDYPIHVDDARYDARPYGTESGYPDFPAGIQGAAPEIEFGKARPTAIKRIVEQRRRILSANRVKQSAAVTYTQCAGVAVPAPPPPRKGSRTAGKKARDVHAGCPKKRETYIAVGLPVRGQPAGLRDVRDTRGENVDDLEGDVWMAQVDQRVVGPSGWTVSQEAWLFQRNEKGELELTKTIPVALIK